MVCTSIEIAPELRAAGIVAFALHGELDIASIPHMKNQVLATVEPRTQRFIFDVHAVTYLDSTALGAFMGLLQRAKVYGGTVAFVAPSAFMVRLLTMTRLTYSFQVYPTIEHAIAHRQSDPSSSPESEGIAA